MASSGESIFGHAVSQILNSWAALQLAVEHSFGGPDSQEKADWMVLAVTTWFQENDGIEIDEMEDFLNDILNAEFDLKVEDGSVSEISRLICSAYRLSHENVSELERRLQSLPKKQSVKAVKQEDDEMEDVSDDESAPSTSGHQHINRTSVHHTVSGASEEMETGQEEDEDGWSVVNRGKKKK